ncbi:hypothetical protein E4U15_002271 [Claviceps sp. LM218 group G6]|nr:hypothetical protein E4U15_002271 [Claviceps sp. LM218 group G6]
MTYRSISISNSIELVILDTAFVNVSHRIRFFRCRQWQCRTTMQNLRYNLDPQGDTILVLRCSNTKPPVWEPNEGSELKQKDAMRRRKLFSSVFMSDTEDGHSHGENAHEPTPERQPIAPTIESNVPNDSGEAHGEKSDRNEVEFRLSSRHLALASPVFKTMLNGFWKESAPPSDQSNGSAKPREPLQSGTDCQLRYELTASEWDAEDFLLLMKIMHGRNVQMPYYIDLETLGRISVLVDYYQCQEVTQFAVGLWINNLSGTLPTTYGRDCVTWMFVSWVFHGGELLEKMTLLAIRTCNGGLGTINLPFPPFLLSTATPHPHGLSKLMCFVALVEMKRNLFIDGIFKMLGRVCKDLRVSEGRRLGLGCNFDCRAMLLGSLLKGMDKNELYGASSVEGVKSSVLSFKSGAWYSVNVSSCPAHSCNLQQLLQPEVEGLWADLRSVKVKFC